MPPGHHGTALQGPGQQMRAVGRRDAPGQGPSWEALRPAGSRSCCRTSRLPQDYPALPQLCQEGMTFPNSSSCMESPGSWNARLVLPEPGPALEEGVWALGCRASQPAVGSGGLGGRVRRDRGSGRSRWPGNGQSPETWACGHRGLWASRGRCWEAPQSTAFLHLWLDWPRASLARVCHGAGTVSGVRTAASSRSCR